MPAFNYGRYIGKALDSILAQTYRPIEIIVVEAGSTDNTREVLAGYGSHIRVYDAPAASPAKARNTGIGYARGELVAFLDADDLWRPEKLTRQMARFEARPELGYCLSLVQTIWADELRDEAEWFRGHPRAGPVVGYSNITLLARRALFETVGLLDSTQLTTDSVDWFLRAADQGVSMEVVPEVLTYHRLHGANLGQRDAAARRREWLRFVKRKLDEGRAAGRGQITANGQQTATEAR